MIIRFTRKGYKFNVPYEQLTEFYSLSALGYFRKIVDEPLKDVGKVQVTVIVDVNIHHTLGICNMNVDNH